MRLLIVGSLAGEIGTASRIAMSRGAKVLHASDIPSALQALRSGKGADLVMMDVVLDIAQFITALQDERIHVPVVACGTVNDTRAAVAAIKAGAKEYVPLPPDAELIAAVLTAVAEESHALVHRDPRMKQVIALAEQIAPSDASVLVTGPSGTGKELVARYLHAKSRRADRPFIAVNCAAIPETLLESELFGHEKGAFTGAVARRLGKFEEANGGTLLLDEISEMDQRLQAKLLRVIQERVVDRLGGSQPVKVDVRIVATSNRNLREEVAKGRFREDLYFRLNVVSLAIPPLRERPQDVAVLAAHFIKKYSEANGVAVRSLSPDALAKLEAHDWPGNVRELENTIHRAVLLSYGDTIGSDAFVFESPLRAQAAAASPSAARPTAESAVDSSGQRTGMVGRTVADVERALIIDTLEHCLGNRTHAANILGISIRTLRNKLRLYSDQGFSVPMPGEGERPVP